MSSNPAKVKFKHVFSKFKSNSVNKINKNIYFSASGVPLIGLLGFTLAALFCNKIGRRWSFMLFSLPVVINWIILYFAKDMVTFMLSRTFGGIGLGALFTLKICTTSEYTSPKARAFFLNLVTTAAPALGTAASHCLGIFLSWRTVALIAIVPATCGVIIPYFWVESPQWLASKGKYEECEQAFWKLRGKNKVTEVELKLLLKMETAKAENKNNSVSSWKKLYFASKKRYFWDLMLVMLFINAYLAAAGKISYNSLATVILEDITGSANVLYFTLVVDGFITVGSCLSCVLIKKMTMRTMLFTTGIVANILLLALSICLYFKNNGIYFQWINIILLSFYFLTVKCGPYPVLEALLGEIFPLEIKLNCFFLSGFVMVVASSLSIMLMSSIVESVGYSGLFILNLVIMSASLWYIWIKLPETKGRTLQEIEIYVKTKNFDNVQEVMNCDQMKALI